ncbi:MAG TPA: D-alanyl-D-alanine carboxypeptidase [Firmicutes bacterium]|jgi:serine-type D-Ala-D-Ala carboxypeptidase (penicillin-binding protein 5/6)|nr:D-alanyl-D-alanine carboxypeptidase [Bacillota bacterium]
MKVIVISRRYWPGVILCIVFLMVSVITTYYSSRPVNTRLYKVRESFPPLIYLPGYEQGPVIHASAGVLIESRSGAVLFAKNPDLRRAPASTTKMMTAIVALEKGDLNKVIKVSSLASRTPGSSLWLRQGDRLSLKELLEGMMLQSGNDGSMAVAEGVAGNVENFVNWMNLKAKEIGALNTNFRNPHGLRAPSHYTTAIDLALIARYGLAHPHFSELVKRKTAIMKWEDKAQSIQVKNTNRLLWYLEGADGVKTGTTNEAGYCLVASATRGDCQFIAVVLNSGDRWGDCARLLEYGFREFMVQKIADHRKAVARLPVVNGKMSWVNLYPRNDLNAVVKKNQALMIEPQVILFQNQATAPLQTGKIWGRIGYRYLDQAVEGVDLINLHSVPKKRSWWRW